MVWLNWRGRLWNETMQGPDWVWCIPPQQRTRNIRKHISSGVPPKWLAQQRQLQRTAAIPLTVLEMVSSPTPSTAGNTGNVTGRWRCFWLFWFPQISRGGHGEHFLCPDDPATGEPEVFDLVFDGCNYQVSPSMTREGKNLERSFKFQAVKRQNLDSRKLT